MIPSIPFFLLYTMFLLDTEAARILAVFPTASISHQVVFRPFTQELARRGHDVTVITTDLAFSKGQAPQNLTEIDLHDVSYQTKEKILSEIMNRKRSPVAQLLKFGEMFSSFIEVQLKCEEFQNILSKDKNHYDLLVIEAWVRPMLVLSYVFNAPVVQISSFGGLIYNYEAIGIPAHPLLYPTFVRQKLYDLTLWDKFKELHIYLWFKYMIALSENAENSMLRRLFGPNVPSVDELSNNIDMLLINNYPIWAGNIPVPPSVVFIGGIYKTVEKELPEDLKFYLDTSKHGVIYLSLGTNVKSEFMTSHTVKIFVNVLSQLPYNVLWKWDHDELPGRSENIKISKWFPQPNLLKHPKIKLFITQGGLQSTEEAIEAGVPLLVMPVYGDQWYNAEKYVHFKIGCKLDMNDLTEEQLRRAIKTVIEDKRYRQNVIKLRSLMKDQKESPLERAVWWTEHVLRYGGGSHLRSPSANISWAEYFEIKLLIVLIILIVIILACFIWVVRYCLYCLKNEFFNVKLKIK